MQTPVCLATLAEYGLIDEVIRPLMSGKEAQIYLVVSQGEERVAKAYREAEHRNFKHRVEYTEGRKTRNSRDQRAMGKRSRYGRVQDEAAWRAAEVDMIYRLSDAGVPVPKPYHFVDSVLIMEMVKGQDGNPAPRLGDLDLEPDEAAEIYEQLLREVVRMLAAGVVHGDLSDFNVLIGTAGPVIIDFPQSVDASANTGARKLLIRDVDNLHGFARRFMPGLRTRPYAQEMWDLYQRGELTADTQLRGQFKAATAKVDTENILGLVREAETDERFRRQRQGLPTMPTPRRREVVVTPTPGSDGRSPRNARGPREAPRAAGQRRSQGGSDDSARRDHRPRPSDIPSDNPRRQRGRGSGTAAGRAGNAPQTTTAGDELTPGQQRRRRRPRRPQHPAQADTAPTNLSQAASGRAALSPEDRGRRDRPPRRPVEGTQRPPGPGERNSNGGPPRPQRGGDTQVATRNGATSDGGPARRRRRRRPRSGPGGADGAGGAGGAGGQQGSNRP